MNDMLWKIAKHRFITHHWRGQQLTWAIHLTQIPFWEVQRNSCSNQGDNFVKEKKKLELDTSGSISGGLEKCIYIYIYIYRHMNGSSVPIRIRIIIISSLCFVSEYEWEFCSN